MKDDIIERQGRYYQYSEVDDTWYPMPTQDQYDFQRFVVFMSGIVLVCFIAWALIQHLL